MDKTMDGQRETNYHLHCNEDLAIPENSCRNSFMPGALTNVTTILAIQGSTLRAALLPRTGQNFQKC